MNDTPTNDADLSVRQYWHDSVLPRLNYTQGTIQSCLTHLRTFEQFANGPIPMRQLTAEMVDAFRDWLRVHKRGHYYAIYYAATVWKTLLVYQEEELKRTTADTPPSEWPILFFFQEVYRLERNVQGTTAYHYDRALRLLMQFARRQVLVKEMSDQLVSRYVKYLEELHYKPKSRATLRTAVISVWRFAARKKYCDPPGDDIRPVKLQRANPQAWSLQELAEILRACDRRPGFFRNGIPQSLYLRTLIEVTYQTGLRRSDVLRVSMTDITDEGIVSMIQGKTLDGHICTVEPTTLARLHQIHERLTKDGQSHADQPLRFPGSLRRLYIIIRELREAAGVRGDGALQKLRRTGATFVEQQYPGAAMRFLGHRTPGLAYRHYVDRTKLGPPPRPPAISGVGD